MLTDSAGQDLPLCPDARGLLDYKPVVPVQTLRDPKGHGLERTHLERTLLKMMAHSHLLHTLQYELDLAATYVIACSLKVIMLYPDVQLCLVLALAMAYLSRL